MITYNQAVSLAERLKSLSPAIRGIEIFGSTATKGAGRDADFVVLVDENLAQEWWRVEHDRIRIRWPNRLYQYRWIMKRFLPYLYERTSRSRRRERLLTALSILGVDQSQLATPDGHMPDFEVFLLPPAWRTEAGVLNEHTLRTITDLAGDVNTRGMFQRVAHDAVRIA